MPQTLSYSHGQESHEIAEQARESHLRRTSFGAELFMGRFLTDFVLPYPEQSQVEKKEGDLFLSKLEIFLKKNVDADAIDRAREIPKTVLQGLAELGCFGMKIPKEYGGLGLSQVNYDRAMALLASHCGSTAVMLSVHQSVGVPQPLMLFGTEEQKRKYLPRLAKGALSAFALTEPEVGSDPAKMRSSAQPSEDGKFFILNGQKLWSTNGPVAEIMVVLALTPAAEGQKKKQITAFIVETQWPGFKVLHRCDFMGLKGIQNGLLAFENMKVPAENLLWERGQGLKLALITIDTGRLTLPAAWTGAAKRCLGICRQWAGQREQWGLAIGRHEAVAQKLAWVSAHTFAMEASTWLASSLADQGKDIRVEAAMAKLFGSEISRRIIQETMQIRGGRGFETADSLKARGEEAIPVERMLRDAEANTIIEGTSEIMRLFIAREAVDRHLKISGGLLEAGNSFGQKFKILAAAAWFYARWYPRLWTGGGLWHHETLAPALHRHFNWLRANTRRLARALFHSMLLYRAELPKKQLVLGSLVDIATELFVMAATCSKAQALLMQNPSNLSPVELADYFCKLARGRIEQRFRGLFGSEDPRFLEVSEGVLQGRFEWVEEGISR